MSWRGRQRGVEDDGDASGGKLAAVVAHDEGVEEARRVASLALGHDDKLVRVCARQVVEAPAREADVARARQEAGRGTIACGGGTEGAVHRHRLRRVLD